ncbi:hypothetical protein GCM10010297_55960 [Streptomyces malachitofuscus]|nr:hypothetical protein GCM10010297_55960 [Streptomyces malachitofuscus]
MSTEARRASLPPRPTVPPRPAHPQAPSGPAPAEPAPQGRTSGGPGAFDTREPHNPPSVPDDRSPDTPEPAPSPAGTTDGRHGTTGSHGRRTPGPGSGPDQGGPTGRGELGTFGLREPASDRPVAAEGHDGFPATAAPRGRTLDRSGTHPAGSGRADGGSAVGREAAHGIGRWGPTAGGSGAASSSGEEDGRRADRRPGAAAAAVDQEGAALPRPRASMPGSRAQAGTDPAAPPPPRASARFPDAPPTVGRGLRTPDAPPSVPPQPTHRPAAARPGAPSETASETTTRLRPVPADPAAPPRPSPGARPGDTPGGSADPARRPPPGDAEAGRGGAPDPALSWSAPMSPGGAPGGRPAFVSFGEPERFDEDARRRPFGRRSRSQIVAAAACLVLGTGLISGAVTGAWLARDSEGSGARQGFAAAGDLWHNVPVDQLFPPTVQGKGAGPGDADRSWTRIAVAPDSGCRGAFDPLLRKVLDPVGCERLLRATYTDATQSHVTTVGLLFTEADAAGMTSLARRFEKERLDRRTDLLPLPYAAKGTAAAGFGAGQRASWAISVLTDAPVVVYAVSGWADGRTVDTPQPAEDAMESGATAAPAQAGLGHEAQGLADRVERGLRKRAGTATEQPS